MHYEFQVPTIRLDKAKYPDDRSGKAEMKIRCYGARGSIPVSGAEYLKYGGDTTCIEIRTKNDEILIIDSGTGIRRLGNRLIKEERFVFSMLFTHSHWDHIMGFPFFKPLYDKRTKIKIFGCPEAQGAIKKLLSDTMTPPHFPVKFSDMQAEIAFDSECRLNTQLDSITVSQIALSHPNKGLGFRITEDGKNFVFLTDNELSFIHPGGLSFQDYVDFSKKADILIHDAEYTEEDYRKTRTWGHSIYTDAVKLGLAAGVKKLGLFHHNQNRTDSEVDAIVETCRRIIKDSNSNMQCFALTQETEIEL